MAAISWRGSQSEKAECTPRAFRRRRISRGRDGRCRVASAAGRSTHWWLGWTRGRQRVAGEGEWITALASGAITLLLDARDAAGHASLVQTANIAWRPGRSPESGPRVRASPAAGIAMPPPAAKKTAPPGFPRGAAF